MGRQRKMSFPVETVLPVCVLICALWYTLNGYLLNRGLNRTYPRVRQFPRVSVLIAARNEEEYLPLCLESLAHTQYPKHLCEIFVLNDRSTDKTLAIAQEYARKDSVFRVLNITHDKYGLKGKMNVLSQGLEKTSGEIILVTDADCVVPESWISDFVSFFTSRTGMAGGLTLLKGPQLIHKLQAFDWLFLQSIASGTAGIGKPVSILGNNFAFRKSAYDEVGGFGRIGFSLTEDMALLQAIDHNTDYDIIYPLEKEHMVRSEAVRSISDIYHQRMRWMSGGKKASAWGYSLMISAFLIKLMILISIISGIISWITLCGILLMLSIEFILPRKILRRVNQKGFIKIWPLFQLYYFLYTMIFGFLFWIPHNVSWKKRIYGSKE